MSLKGCLRSLETSREEAERLGLRDGEGWKRQVRWSLGRVYPRMLEPRQLS
jgi:hypothetical protein